MKKIPMIVLFGPTASGKTATAIEICKMVGGEVVTADSMQVYKYMNIGTAKPDKEEMSGIPHHMIDIVEPTVNYSLADYKEEAQKCISDIYKRGKTPVLAGGTGLYIDTVADNIELSEFESDDAYRQKLYELADEKGNEYVHDMLKKIDPESASEIHFNNLKRVVRALEFYKVSGITKSQHLKNSKNRENPYSTVKFCMDMPRDVLYDRINKRVDVMIANGLVNEVENILEMGVERTSTAMQGIGYKEIVDYLYGNLTLDESVDLIKQSTRRYAKRQITWFKREQNTTLLNPYDDNYLNLLKKTIEKSLNI